MSDGPRIYNLFPLLVGSIDAWRAELPRIARMDFNWIFLNPFHLPGFSGSLYAVKDHYRLNPLIAGAGRQDADRQLADFVADAADHGLRVMMDLVINHTAKDADLVHRRPEWYARDHRGEVISPSAIDPADTSKVTVWGDLAELDFQPRPEREALIDYWRGVVTHYVKLGFAGFRCDAAYKVPAEVWKPLIEAARVLDPRAVFAAESLGCRLDEVAQLAPADFDFLFNSSKWWDFKAPWALDQYETFRHLAPSIAFPESHDTPRLANDLALAGIGDPKIVEAAYRQRYLFAALFSTGVMVPMGYEFGWARALHVVKTRPTDREAPRFDISGFIAEVNRMKRDEPVLNEEGPQGRIGAADGDVVALRRSRSQTGDWVLSLLNSSPVRQRVNLNAISPDLAGELSEAAEITPGAHARAIWTGGPMILEPFDLRVFGGGDRSSGRVAASDAPGAPTHRTRSKPVVIQNVYPELDCGRYPIKRVVGDTLSVWADIFREGHGRIGAVLKLRKAGSPVWMETPMERINPGLDRWTGRVALSENTRYFYTIEAWPDRYESWREEVEKKRAAGQNVDLELIEGEDLVPGDRTGAVTYDHELEVVVDRPRARFGAWYEMVPRSQGTIPDRSATFKDCERRLPEIAAMGFDVVYLPPIHPIGRTNRKGRNNSLVADEHAPGSLYAIGSEDGGHDAVHPELGTLEDFRSFVDACRRHGMEVALDYAVQASPDHPWIRDHPEWFVFRPDGTIKFAENPPKKYEDIVNVNFDSPARDALMAALRDVVLHWVEQGVKIFRVDNPHTKPIPFWEWMIRDVQARHPDTIFLSEAFTRPRVLEMLAKIGFTQSYTYFTWRNTKQELTDYATELTQTAVREYLRPNFFTNTPDILPPILQTGGRPAFQIRLVLAATLATTYGIYNGFELCEGRAIPGTEEYAGSEKYEYKVWDWDRPGNIKDYIARLNAIRRENPALQQFDNLVFHPASDDRVLFYGKATPDNRNVVFIAVTLDPHEPREAEIALPLGSLGLGEDAAFEVEELLTGRKFSWKGGRHVIRFEPSIDPAFIFRLAAPGAVQG